MNKSESENIKDTPFEVQRYELGMMTPDEEVAFEHSLAKSTADHPELKEANEALTAMYEHLSKDMPRPSKQIKKKLLDQVTEKVSMADDFDPEAFILRAGDAKWVDTNIPGIEFKILYKSEDDRTMLIARFAPGASLPSHRRLGTEECLVLSGDFWADGHKLTAGDFIAGLEGNEPDPVYSEGGCELLLKMLIPNEIRYN